MAFTPAPTPMSRVMMRSLKAKADEENRLIHVEQNVNKIYQCVVQSAKTSTSTQYKIDLHGSYATHSLNVEFIIANIDEIIRGLQLLFPDCSVEFKSLTMAMGPDGQMHDVSTLDQKAMMFIRHTQVKQCMIIDWS